MKIFNQKLRQIRVILSLILTVVIIANLSACSSTKIQSTDLMEDTSSETASVKNIDNKFISNTADFSIELFKKTISDKENALISPLSVMLALAMTANGADNETLLQMENVLGKDISLEDLNDYLYSYIKGLPSEDKMKLNIANSIWFRDNQNRLMVEKDFLQKNANFYNADIYKSAFDDQTLKDINDWVSINTDGMINKILDRIGSDTVMYLINAIVFDAQWETVYNKNNIIEGEFITVDGIKQSAEFMTSDEYTYLDDGSATGFMKPYYNNKYSFAALLPNEDISIEDYIESLTGNGFMDTINNASETAVSVTLPKFSYDYTINMNDALISLGMPDSFSGTKADFSKLGKSEMGNIYIGEVLHKTFISVDELGTKAGAVTKVEIKETGSMVTKTVKLDRPFIYAIIDNSTNLPIFIGTVMTINN